MQIAHMTSTWGMTYRRMLYIFVLCNENTSKCTCLVSWEKHTHMITSKWFRFIIAKIYNILRYVIPHVLRHMCNLHIKETEICQKRRKGIKNWKITYSVILSVLSNKTNLILGFSSPLRTYVPKYNFMTKSRGFWQKRFTW